MGNDQILMWRFIFEKCHIDFSVFMNNAQRADLFLCYFAAEFTDKKITHSWAILFAWNKSPILGIKKCNIEGHFVVKKGRFSKFAFGS